MRGDILKGGRKIAQMHGWRHKQSHLHDYSTFVSSFCRPSRGPTSTMRTSAGNSAACRPTVSLNIALSQVKGGKMRELFTASVLSEQGPTGKLVPSMLPPAWEKALHLMQAVNVAIGLPIARLKRTERRFPGADSTRSISVTCAPGWPAEKERTCSAVWAFKSLYQMQSRVFCL